MRHNINAMASVPILCPPPSLNLLNFPGSTGSISFHLSSVFVMDAGWKDGEMTPRACINPRILWMSEETAVGPEGCLSIPGVTAQVRRAARLRLGYTDLDGAAQEVDLHGAEAIVAQHEYDHLDGLVHFDRLEPEVRAALMADYGALP